MEVLPTNRCGLIKEDVVQLIKTFLELHSKLKFEKAQELVDVERQRLSASTINSSTLRLWLTFLNFLNQLALFEKTYYSLMFFTTKFSFRKENHIREIYAQLSNELQECATNVAQLNAAKSKDECAIEKFLGAILMDFSVLALVRVDLINFYISLSGKDCSIAEASKISLTKILNLYVISTKPKKAEESGNINIKTVYEKELTILSYLFSVQICIADCNLIDSLIQLKILNRMLTKWFLCFECDTILKPSSSLFFSFTKKAKPTEKLALPHFLNQFYRVLVAKLSLYFHDVVSQFVTQNDVKLAFTSNYSFLYTFRSFYRKNSPQIICILVSRIDQNTPFYGFGYHRFLSKFSNEYCKSTSGIHEKYPPLFIYPQEKRVIDAFYVNIVTFVQEICLNSRLSTTTTSSSNMLATAAASSADNKLKFLYDKVKNQTFFTANIELNIHLAMAYDRKVQERDSAVANFFNETLMSLKLIKLFQDFRNFPKSS